MNEWTGVSLKTYPDADNYSYSHLTQTKSSKTEWQQQDAHNAQLTNLNANYA